MDDEGLKALNSYWEVPGITAPDGDSKHDVFNAAFELFKKEHPDVFDPQPEFVRE